MGEGIDKKGRDSGRRLEHWERPLARQEERERVIVGYEFREHVGESVQVDRETGRDRRVVGQPSDTVPVIKLRLALMM